MCKRERKRCPAWAVFWVAGAVLAAGCAMKHPPVAPTPSGPPARLLTATRQQLIASYNDRANSVRSLNASVSMKLTAGTAYSGIIKDYHEISGFILAQKPASIRVIGQAPIVGTTIFDMVSDGATFHMYIPSKNMFLEGPANLQRESAKPIENLRPQHLVEAIFWTPLSLSAPVLFQAGDESESRYYILTVVASAAPGDSTATGSSAAPNWQIERRIWFDRTDLSVARVQIYDPNGSVNSDINYGPWRDFGSVRFAEQIEITRPAEHYGLRIRINKLSTNTPIAPERFEMKQPPGTQLVHVGEETKEPQP